MHHTPESNVKVLEEAFRRVSVGNVEGCLELMTPDFIINIAEMPYAKTGHDAWRKHTEYMLSAFPDFHVEIEDAVAAEDKVAVRVRITGTHRGEFLGNAPTEKRISYKSHETYRFKDGKLAEEWLCSDNMTMLTEVGAFTKGRLVAMWLASYRTWFGFGAGIIFTIILINILNIL